VFSKTVELNSQQVEISMAVLWLSPLFSLTRDLKQICVEKNSKDQLCTMAKELAGSEDLLAIYVPLSSEEIYRPGAQKGRIAGLVKLLQMPTGKKIDCFIEEFQQPDLATGKMRWPFGWPIESVLVPPAENCPMMRDILIKAYERDCLKEYPLQGPHRLEKPLQLLIKSAFRELD
jgi:hypothetical protein